MEISNVPDEIALNVSLHSIVYIYENNLNLFPLPVPRKKQIEMRTRKIKFSCFQIRIYQ